MTDLARSAPSHSPRVCRIAEWLRRYPHLAPHEVELLLFTFRRLPMLDLALLTMDEQLRPRLDAFRRDHARALRPPLWQYLLFYSFPVTLLAAMIWGLWSAAAG